MAYRVPPWMTMKPVTKVSLSRLMLDMLESGEPAAVKWVTSAWRVVGKAITSEQAEAILRSGAVPEAVLQAVREGYDRIIAGELMAAQVRIAETAASRIMVGMGAEFTASSALQAMIERRTTRLAVDMSDGTRDLIDYLARYYTGVRPTTAGVFATTLRSFVGLTDREAAWVTKYEASLIDSGAARGTITALTRTMKENLLAARALRVARTEIAFSVTDAINESTRQARTEGLIRFDLVKQWDAANDAATCEECAAMHGEIVRFGEPFSCGTDPPLHPNCRCVHNVYQLIPGLEEVA